MRSLRDGGPRPASLSFLAQMSHNRWHSDVAHHLAQGNPDGVAEARVSMVCARTGTVIRAGAAGVWVSRGNHEARSDEEAT